MYTKEDNTKDTPGSSSGRHDQECLHVHFGRILSVFHPQKGIGSSLSKLFGKGDERATFLSRHTCTNNNKTMPANKLRRNKIKIRVQSLLISLLG